ncbi:sodium:calcium antiporter [Tabrizicola sp.]|uniref:sodium:calcium antiporter n=1 Tax=Tabrizicola sp. TaxID=2005166 RepID=UPI003F2E7559
MTYLLFLIGLVALYFGAEYLVKGSTAVARSFKLSPMLIGLTIVGFGTSTPELIVSLEAALEDRPGIAIGNILGSNIANILLILGISALIAPLIIPFGRLRNDLVIMVLVSAGLWAIMMDGDLSRLEGIVMVLLLGAYVWFSIWSGSGHEDGDTSPLPPQWQAWLMIIGGLLVLIVGARLLVDSAVEIATMFGVSEAVIGLTIVAVGTSLPEMATSIIAAIRGQREIAVGNIVGSNIYNILGILGLTSLVAPIIGDEMDPRFLAGDMPWVLGTAVGLTVLAFIFKGIPRIAGAVLLAAYVVYVWLLMAPATAVAG